MFDGNSESLFKDNGGANNVGIGVGAALMFNDNFQMGIGYDTGVKTHNLMFTLTRMFGR